MQRRLKQGLPVNAGTKAVNKDAKFNLKVHNTPKRVQDDQELSQNLDNMKLSNDELSGKKDDKMNPEDMSTVRSRTYMDDPRNHRRINKKLTKLNV